MESDGCSCNRKLKLEEITVNKCIYTMLVIFTAVARIVITVLKSSAFDVSYTDVPLYMSTNLMTMFWLAFSMISSFTVIESCKTEIEQSKKYILLANLILQHMLFILSSYLCYNDDNYKKSAFYIMILLLASLLMSFYLTASISKIFIVIYSILTLFVIYNLYILYKIM